MITYIFTFVYYLGFFVKGSNTLNLPGQGLVKIPHGSEISFNSYMGLLNNLMLDGGNLDSRRDKYFTFLV